MMMTRQKKLCESHVVWCVIELDNRQTMCGVQWCDLRCHEKREIKFLIARDMVSQIWIQVGCGLHAPILKSTAEKQRNWYMRTSNKSSQHNWQLFNIYKPRHNNVVEVIEYAWSRHAITDVWVSTNLSSLWNDFNRNAILWQMRFRMQTLTKHSSQIQWETFHWRILVTKKKE